MEFSDTIFPVSKNTCRTCLLEANPLKNVQDVVEHDNSKIKLIDILVFLNCLESNDPENWPQVICSLCTTKAITAYNFKLNCLKANSTLTQFLNTQSIIERSDLDSIDINVVYQDHEYYFTPLLSHQTNFDFEPSTSKEMVPLPPVTEITYSEKTLTKETEKKFACTLCPKTYNQIHSLKSHLLRHTNKRLFLCQKCGKQFHTGSGLQQHLTTHKSFGQYRCGFCHKIYKTKSSLRIHFRKAHSGKKTSFDCVQCGKIFASKYNLNMHLKVHNRQKMYQCPECPKSYTRASYLSVHSIVHTNQPKPRPFSCYYQSCEKRFPSKYSLQVHIAHIHSTEKPYKCDTCTKCFCTKHRLRNHMEFHKTGGINCNLCGKKMSCKSSLQRHLMHSHKEPANNLDLSIDDANEILEAKTEMILDLNENDMILEPIVDDIFLEHMYW